jgi:hypothetical protein
MLCNNTKEIDYTDKYSAIHAIVVQYDWALSQNNDGMFVCCNKCYSKAFDLSKGGKVGLLRDEFNHLREIVKNSS